MKKNTPLFKDAIGLLLLLCLFLAISLLVCIEKCKSDELNKQNLDLILWCSDSHKMIGYIESAKRGEFAWETKFKWIENEDTKNCGRLIYFCKNLSPQLRYTTTFYSPYNIGVHPKDKESFFNWYNTNKKRYC